jgi:steroid 5-alpha reductase family enzyme
MISLTASAAARSVLVERDKTGPANGRRIMDNGRWARTRQPNHFSDAHFLGYATEELQSAKFLANRQRFHEYRSRASFFVPCLPRSRIL